MEREKARQRTYDAMVRKAQALHVTGGKVFGYDNVDVPSPEATARGYASSARSTIEQAAIVRRIFELYASGVGMVKIAHRLNQEGVKPAAWARLGTVWHPRDAAPGALPGRGRLEPEPEDRPGGTKKQRKRDESEWIRIEAPELRIVSEDLWQRVKRRSTLGRRSSRVGRTGS